MFEQVLHIFQSAQVMLTGHPVLAILGLALIFALSSAVVETIMYWIARTGGRPLVLRYARWLRLDIQKIEKVESLYARWGIRLVFFGRFLPGVKALLSVPAGISRMNYGAYIGASFSAAYIYNILWFAAAIFLGLKVKMFGISIF